MVPGRSSARLALSLAALLLLACTGPRSDRDPAVASSSDRLLVVTSVNVLADLIQQVGGERVHVRALVPAGADPNTFQPAHREVLSVARADLVIFNGRGLDRTLRAVVNNAARPDLPIITLSDGLPALESGLASTDGDEGAPSRGNPYLWLNPHNAIEYVNRIRDALLEADPAGESSYRAAAKAYAERLTALDAALEQQLAEIPAERRKLVTLHDGFPYLAERYGFQLVGVVIKRPGREPSAREVADIAQTLREERVTTVFTEPQLNARLLKLAARDEGVQIFTLYSATLDWHVPTYEALLSYNARQLVNGLK